MAAVNAMTAAEIRCHPGIFESGLAQFIVGHGNVLQGQPMSEPRAQGLCRRLLGGKPLGEKMGRPRAILKRRQLFRG